MRSYCRLFSWLPHFRQGKDRDTFDPGVSVDVPTTPSERNDDRQPKIADATNKQENNIEDANVSESNLRGGPETSTKNAGTVGPAKPTSPVEADPALNFEADSNLSLNEHAELNHLQTIPHASLFPTSEADANASNEPGIVSEVSQNEGVEYPNLTIDQSHTIAQEKDALSIMSAEQNQPSGSSQTSNLGDASAAPIPHLDIDLASSHVVASSISSIRASPTGEAGEETVELKNRSSRLEELIAEVVTPSGPIVSASILQSSPKHSWSAIENATVAQTTDSRSMLEKRAELARLLREMRNAKDWKPYFDFRKMHSSEQTIASQELWTIFPPKSLVCAKSFLGQEQIFRVERIQEAQGEREVGKHKDHIISATAYDWDGDRFEQYTYTLSIPHFEGSREICTLPIYPLDYHSDDKGIALRKGLVERGRRFVEFVAGEGRKNGFQCEYNNDAIDSSSSLVKIQGKIIVDHLSFLRPERTNAMRVLPPLGDMLPSTCPNSRCPCDSCCQKYQNPPEESIEQETFARSPAQLLLCPPRVLGLALQEVKWCQFSVNSITEIGEKAKSKRFLHSDLMWRR